MSTTSGTSAGRRSSIPPAESYTLANGLEVLVVPSGRDPYLTATLQIPGGALAEPEGLEGLTACWAQMLRHGTQRFSEAELSEALDTAAVRLGTTTFRDHTELAGDLCTLDEESLGLFFAALGELTLRPTFPEDQLEKVRALKLGRLRDIRDQSEMLVVRAFEATLFEGHAAGRALAGSVASLAAVTRAHLQTFHERHCLPQGAQLGIAGDVDAATALEWAERTFGDWAATGPTFAPAPAPPAQPPGLRITLVDKEDPGLSQVHFRLGHRSPMGLESPDYFAYRLAVQILGGDFTARLNQRLRVAEGLTYGAHYGFRSGRLLPGSAAVSTYVEIGRLEEALKLTLAELEAFATGGPRPEELRAAQDSLVLSFPFRFETPADALDQHLWVRREGLPADFLATYQERIDAVDLDEVRKVAAAQFPGPASAELVVVGNAACEPALRALAGPRGEIRRLTLADLGL